MSDSLQNLIEMLDEEIFYKSTELKINYLQALATLELANNVASLQNKLFPLENT